MTEYTEDYVLDIINIGRTYRDESLGDLSDVSANMIRWLMIMTHGDGRPLPPAAQ